MTDIEQNSSPAQVPAEWWPEHPGHTPPINPPFVPPDDMWQRYRGDGTGPEPHYRQPGTDWRRVGIAVLVSMFFVVLLSLLFFACVPKDDPSGGDPQPTDGDQNTETPDGPSTTLTPSTTEGPGETEPDEQQPPSSAIDGGEEGPAATTPAQTAGATFPPEVLDELMAFVERERGHKFKTRPVIEALDDEEFESRLLEDFEEERQDIETRESVLRALRLLPRSSDLYTLQRSLYGGAVVGAYYTETSELVLRGVEPSPYVRVTLVHELVHALEDQIFELYRPELNEANDESGFGFGALVEGSAVYIEERYIETLGRDELIAMAAEKATIGASIDYSAFPQVLLEQLVAPYTYGPELVRAIMDEGGMAGLDAAYGSPPVSSEQVLEPRRFLDGDAPTPGLIDPPADGATIDEGVIGQFVLYLMFSNAGMSGSSTAEAAQGWGGDRYVAWITDDRRSCLRANLTMDTPQDLYQASTALQQWARAHGSASVVTQGDVITFTACS